MAHGVGILCPWLRVCPFPKGSRHIWLILGPQHWHIDTCLHGSGVSGYLVGSTGQETLLIT